MSNVFDSSNAGYLIPRYLVRGDYYAWRNKQLITDYPPASYTLQLVARLEGDSAGEKTITAAEDNGEFLFEITAVDWDVGTWFYDLHVVQNSDSKRHTLKSGVILAMADRAEDPDDPRALPRKMVAKLEALMYDRVDNRQIDQTSFDNGETSATRDYEILRRELEYWKRQRAAAAQQWRAMRGLPHSGNIRVRG